MNSSEGAPVETWTPRWTRDVRGVRAHVSTRGGGVSSGLWSALNLSRLTGDLPEHVAENRARFARAAGFDAARTFLPLLEHGVRLREVCADDAECFLHADNDWHGDGIWTRSLGVSLLVTAADCASVFLATDDGRAVALLHAGWRGGVAGIVAAAMEQLEEGTGVPPEHWVAALGPTIGPCCFEVGEEVAGEFLRRWGDDSVRLQTGRWHADLPRGLGIDLRSAGVQGEVARPPCTRCENERFFSHRGAAGKPAGRLLAALWRAASE